MTSACSKYIYIARDPVLFQYILQKRNRELFVNDIVIRTHFHLGTAALYEPHRSITINTNKNLTSYLPIAERFNTNPIV